MRLYRVFLGVLLTTIIASTMMYSIIYSEAISIGKPVMVWGDGGSSNTTTVNITYYFYILGRHSCPHCRATYSYLVKTYGDKHVYFCDSDANQTCLDKIYSMYTMTGNEAFLAVPQVYVVYNCTLSAIVIGEVENKTFLDSLLEPNHSDRIPLYYGAGERGGILYGWLRLGNQYSIVEEYLNYDSVCGGLNVSGINNSVGIGGGAGFKHRYSLVDVLPSLLFLALIDSVNPCTMTIYFTFILTLLSARKRFMGPAILFLVVVYLGYYLIGVGFRLLASYIPSGILLGLAMLVGFYNIYDASRLSSKGVKCSVCERFSMVDKILRNPYLAALILSGISVSILLPCTSGPLLVFVSLIKDYPLYLSLISLTIYTMIFSTPLILILVMGFIMGRREKIANYLTEHAAVVEFIAGLLIVLFAFVMLLATL